MKLRQYLISICAGLLFMTSCYDLEQLPNDSVVVDFDDEEQVYSTMVGVYEALNASSVYNGFYSMESITDLGWSYNGWWPAYDKYNISLGTATADNGAFSETWSAHYDVISRANELIRNLEESSISDDQKIQYRAECRFCRALAYNNLLNFYGGVPIYDDTFDGDASEMLYARSSEDEVRDFIISDLEYACEHLSSSRESIGQASQGAAYALLGKVYLYNEEYENAKTALLQVVNGGYGFKLNSSYSALFRPNGYEDGADDCEEIIFGVENISGTGTEYGLHVQFLGNRASYGGCINTNVPSTELVNMYEWLDGTPFDWDEFYESTGATDLMDLYGSTFDENGQYVVEYPPLVDKLRDMYEQRDPRMNETIILPYTMYEGFVNNEDKDVEFVISADGLYYSNETYGYVRQAYGNDTYLWRKFVQEYDWDGLISSRADSPVNWPIIRYADVLLMLAECYNQTGDQTSAVSYINQVRDRVGMPGINSGPSQLAATTQDEVFERIKHERAVEFALEGIRWFDLVRWGELVEKTNGMEENDVLGNQIGTTKAITDKYTKWAIPQSEIDINSSLTQNSGW